MSFKRLYLEITNICNLSCSFCPPLKRKPRSMSLEEIEKILREFSSYPVHIYPHIKGEPLLHPEFKEFASLTKKYNMPLNVTTNGLFILENEETLLRVARQVNISVHALLDGQIKDKEKYLSDIISFGLKAKEMGKPNVSYRLWTESKNECFGDKSYEIIKLLSDKFKVEIPGEIKKGRNAIKLSDNVYLSLMNKFSWPDMENKAIRKTGNCLGGKDMLGILSDGMVVPCCLDSDGIISLGNIFEEDLGSILKKERYINLRNGFCGGNLSEELCKKCSFYQSRKTK